MPRPLVRIRIHTTNTMADADAYCGARLALARKHFGEYSNDGNGLSDEARTAYGFAFRSIALKYVESGRMDAGWTYLSKSIALCPGLLGDLNTFYEVACGDQTRGTRGQVQGLDLAANSEELLRRLDALFASADAPAQALRSTAYGKAHLALAMLADQAGDWSAARGYLLEAIRFDPGLLRDRNVLRRFAKVMAGQRLTGVAKQIVGRESSSEGFRPHTPPE
ncbi:MAG: hypothetical protein GWN58_52560 [Anaerolineae bacterium]|nr:hypothetical protein [Anaerolineae bacterium]